MDKPRHGGFTNPGSDDDRYALRAWAAQSKGPRVRSAIWRQDMHNSFCCTFWDYTGGIFLIILWISDLSSPLCEKSQQHNCGDSTSVIPKCTPNRPAARYVKITQAEWSTCPIYCFGNTVWLTRIFLIIRTVNPDMCGIIGQMYLE